MSELDIETVKHLSQLCRIAVTDEEAQTLLEDLSQALDSVQKLQDLDTENVPPCYQIQERFDNVMRPDTVGETLSKEEFLANSPDHVGGMIRVPPIIQG